MRNHKKKPNKKSTKEYKICSESEESDDSSIDLDEDVHPLTNYIDDRSELLNQVFNVIKKKQLKTMLPSVLKNISLDEIKSLCLVQLLGMSKKRILAVLEAREMETSSSDSDNAEEIEDQDTLEIGINPKEMGDILKETDSPKEKSLKSQSFETNNFLDILELEMRARAIRALLKQQEDLTSEKKNNIQIENQNDKVKLSIHGKRKWDASHSNCLNSNKNKDDLIIQDKSKEIISERELIKSNNTEDVVRRSKVFGKIRRKILNTSKNNKLIISSQFCTDTKTNDCSIK